MFIYRFLYISTTILLHIIARFQHARYLNCVYYSPFSPSIKIITHMPLYIVNGLHFQMFKSYSIKKFPCISNNAENLLICLLHTLTLYFSFRVTLEVLWCVTVYCRVLYPGVMAVLNPIILVFTLKCVLWCHGSMTYLTAINLPENHTSHLYYTIFKDCCTT